MAVPRASPTTLQFVSFVLSSQSFNVISTSNSPNAYLGGRDPATKSAFFVSSSEPTSRRNREVGILLSAQGFLASGELLIWLKMSSGFASAEPSCLKKSVANRSSPAEQASKPRNAVRLS